MSNEKSKNPPYHRWVLDNGLVVILYPMRSVRSVFINLRIRSGGAYENQKTRGASHFVEHLIHQGSKNFPRPGSLAEALEAEGMIENGGTGKLESFFWIKTPCRKIKKALEFLYELIFLATLPEKRMETVRQTILVEYHDFWQHPENQFAQEMLEKRFEKKNPYTHDSLGSLENIRSFKQKEIVAWKEKFYRPGHMILSLAGNLSPPKTLRLIKDLWGKEKSRKPIEEPKIAPKGYSSFLLHYHPLEREQLQFVLSFPAFGWREVPRNKRICLALLGEILGKGPTSRLFRSLREKKGLVYRINAHFQSFPWKGAFLLLGSTRKEKIVEVMKLISQEIEKVLQKGFLDNELTRGKNILGSGTIFQFESPESISSYFAGEELEEKIWLPEDHIAAGKKITEDNLKRMAKTIFNFSQLNIGLLGKVEEKTISQIKRIFWA